MNQENQFSVSRFKNRNGALSFRVDGRLHGVRIRRNFKSKEEAAAEKAALEISAEQAVSGLRSITTALTVEQAREAEAVFQRFKDRTQSLAYYVDYALTNYRDPILNRPIDEAIKDYLALRAMDEQQGHPIAPTIHVIPVRTSGAGIHFPWNDCFGTDTRDAH